MNSAVISARSMAVRKMFMPVNLVVCGAGSIAGRQSTIYDG
jgi:hypothetical protein